MAVVPFDESYHGVDICELAGTGIAAVALKRETTPTQIWFRRSVDDGQTWSAPVQVGIILQARYVKLLQKNWSRSSRLMVTDGVSVMWKSENFGKTWEAF